MPAKTISLSTTTYKAKKLDVPEEEVYQIAPGGKAFHLDGTLIKEIEVDKPCREVEIDMLKQLANVAFSQAKDIKAAHVAMDIFGVLENLAEGTDLVLGDSDITMLREAFNSLKDKRPSAWMKASAVIKQLLPSE